MSPDQMTDAEKIEYLATKVMGWERVIVDYHDLKPKQGFVLGADGESYMTPSNAKWERELDSEDCEWMDNSVGEYWVNPETRKFIDESFGNAWNPLEDWNAWRQVEEKVMEDQALWEEFCMVHFVRPMPEDTLFGFMSADLPTRVNALISAHQSLSLL